MYYIGIEKLWGGIFVVTDFGFVPVSSGKRYFISYNTQDKGRVAPIAMALYNSGVPLWYDFGLEYGEEWKRQIAINISRCDAVIMFITNSVFRKERTFVYIEYEVARRRKKRIIPVFLDRIDDDSVNDQYRVFWINLNDFHIIDYYGDVENTADEIRKAIGYRDAVKKAIPAGYTVSKEAVPTLPALNPAQYVVRMQDKPAIQKPFGIIAVALALVVAIVCGAIWLPKVGIRSETDTTTIESITQPTEENTVVTNTINVKVGDHIIFGNYPQNGNSPEPIEWRVLDVQGDKALMISEYLLDTHKFDDDNNDWESSEIRAWLNSDFYNTAFSESEKYRVQTVKNNNSDYSEYGKDTEDKVFCLSIEETEKYFKDEKDRRAAPTSYAIKHGAWISDYPTIDNGMEVGVWWLRSPGWSAGLAAYVESYGYILGGKGGRVYFDDKCVRPVMLVSL